MLSNFRKTVEEYYPHIDAVDTDWVLSIFTPDAVYERADAKYEGLPALRKFFCEDRQIRGEHIVDEILVDEGARTAIATGRFEGRGAEGDTRSVGFADFWTFNGEGLVVKRRTYLALGHAYVER